MKQLDLNLFRLERFLTTTRLIGERAKNPLLSFPASTRGPTPHSSSGTAAMTTWKNHLGRGAAIALVAAAAATLTATSTFAVPNYDGLWSVSIVTEKGDCDPRLSLSGPHFQRPTHQCRRYPVHHHRQSRADGRHHRDGERRRQERHPAPAGSPAISAAGPGPAAPARAPGPRSGAARNATARNATARNATAAARLITPTRRYQDLLHRHGRACPGHPRL